MSSLWSTWFHVVPSLDDGGFYLLITLQTVHLFHDKDILIHLYCTDKENCRKARFKPNERLVPATEFNSSEQMKCRLSVTKFVETSAISQTTKNIRFLWNAPHWQKVISNVVGESPFQRETQQCVGWPSNKSPVATLPLVSATFDLSGFFSNIEKYSDDAINCFFKTWRSDLRWDLLHTATADEYSSELHSLEARGILRTLDIPLGNSSNNDNTHRAISLKRKLFMMPRSFGKSSI